MLFCKDNKARNLSSKSRRERLTNVNSTLLQPTVFFCIVADKDNPNFARFSRLLLQQSFFIHA